MIYGVWQDGCRLVGATPEREDAIGMIRECGLSEDEAEQLIALAQPEGWASVRSAEARRVTLVLTDNAPLTN